MRDLELGRLIREIRRRRGWRQADCGARAGVHRSTWSLMERGHFDRMSLAAVRRCLEALDVRLELIPRWRGADLDRLRDEAHAALEATWKRRLERWGWQVWAEVSFNHYGDRGRVDLLGWQPVHRLLVVVEVKSEVVDVQALLGGLDTKVRVAPMLARRLGLPTVAGVLPMLVVADGTTSRERVARVATLFSRFELRGREAMHWLRMPAAGGRGRGGGAGDSAGVGGGAAASGLRRHPAGILVFTDLRYATGGSVKPVGSHRVRRRRGSVSVNEVPRLTVPSARPP